MANVEPRARLRTAALALATLMVAALLEGGLTPAQATTAGTSSGPAVTMVTDNIDLGAPEDDKNAADFATFSDSVHSSAPYTDTNGTATATVDTGSDGGLLQIELNGSVDGAEHDSSSGHVAAIMFTTFQVNQAIPVTMQVSASAAANDPWGCTDEFLSTITARPDLNLGVAASQPCSDYADTHVNTSVSGVLPPGQWTLLSEGIADQVQGSGNVQFDTIFSFGAPATTDFDWSMPDRFGFDKNGDGLTDYYPPDGNLVIDPASWEVDFTATDPTACGPGFTHQWFIDSVQVDPSDPNVITYDPATCDLSYGFPEEGVHDVGFQATDAQGNVVASAEHTVTVQDFLIVSIGDSVASGEGNADIAGSSPRWENQQCHRSAAAGPAQAAELLEHADPHTSVTFIHLACSGATILKGLLRSYEGIEPGPQLDPQVSKLTSLVGTREIDAVMVSIGANDVRFGDIVQSCFLHSNCDDATSRSSAASKFNRAITALPGRYTQLANALNRPRLHLSSDRVYITEYFDPTRDDAGQACADTILEDAPFAPLGDITAQEATWASTGMLGGLNAAVDAAAAAHGWHYVGGQFADFADHGYCATDRWVDTYSDSEAGQDDQNGTLHPNRAGQLDFASHLQASLQSDLYVGGDLNQPRAPAP